MKNFKNLAEFSDYMEGVLHKQVSYETKMLEAMAQYVEDDAKKKFGVYQEAAGPFHKWAELSEATKADRLAKGYSENDPLLRTGATKDSIFHQVIGKQAFIGSDSDILLWQEFGTPNARHPIPARSTLGAAAFQSIPVLEKIAQEFFVAWLLNKNPSIKKFR